MPLNISKGNMYEFISHTFNVIKGKCPHNCSYCFCKKFGKQKEIHFDNNELKTDLGDENYIFVGSSNDMFANEIKESWVIDVLDYCSKFNNKYLFQSKYPINFNRFNLIDRDPIIEIIRLRS